MRDEEQNEKIKSGKFFTLEKMFLMRKKGV